MLRLLRQAATLLIFSLLVACNQSSQQKPLQTQTHSGGDVRYATLSNDGRFALITPTNNPTALWDLNQKEQRYQWYNSSDHNGIIASSISSDNHFALTAEAKSLALWDLTTGTTIKYWTVSDEVTHVALGNSAYYALVGYSNGAIDYIDLNDGTVIRQFQHEKRINHVAISRDERFALSTSDDHTAKLWNIQTGELLATLPHEQNVTIGIISAKNTYIATATNQGQIKLWDLRSGKFLKTLNQDPLPVSALAFAHSEQRLAAGSEAQTFTIWDLPHGTTTKHWQASSPVWQPTATVIRAVQFSDDDKQLISEDSTGVNHVWPSL